jgi:acyl-CoA thioesterase FadM
VPSAVAVYVSSSPNAVYVRLSVTVPSVVALTRPWAGWRVSVASRSAQVGFPRVAAAFEYHRPLLFEDEFAARVRIVAIGRSSLRFACSITRGEERIATGTLTVVCVAKQAGGPMKSTPLPPEVAGRFEVSPEGVG